MIIEDLRSISFPVIRVRQPIGDFYVGAMAAKDLIDITYFDIRRLVHEDGIDTYLGIQRRLNKKRVEELKKYVNASDATFPTAVILAVQEQSVLLKEVEGGEQFFWMQLTNSPGNEGDEGTILYRQIARVIDGQHRIVGLEGFSGDLFEVNVAIFVGADISDQANIFATVNLAQTKVNRSLVYDLFELSKARSPEKTCHNVAVALDRTEGSPFFRRIKRLGTATEGRFGETLSQATVVQGILQYISSDRLQILEDRETGKRGGRWTPVPPEVAKKLVLRPMFVEDRDGDIAELVWNYFEAVSQRWPRAWNSGGTGMILNKTNGYNGLMRFFRPAYRHFVEPGQLVSAEQFLRLFKEVQLDDDDFTRQRFVPGTSGATALFHELIKQTRVEN